MAVREILGSAIAQISQKVTPAAPRIGVEGFNGKKRTSDNSSSYSNSLSNFIVRDVECKPRERAPIMAVNPNASKEERARIMAWSESTMDGAIVFPGNAHKGLCQKICNLLNSPMGEVECKRFADGEVSLKFIDSLRGKHVFLVQPTSPPVNEHVMELLLSISTCRRASAKSITAVIPYYGYARQDRKLSSRVPISAADVARMIEAMGVDRVIAVDLHCGQIQGFFGPRVPVDNLEAGVIGMEYFAKKGLKNVVVVSPDAGGVYRARKFQEGLQTLGVEDPGIAMLIKQRVRANEIDRIDLVGAVEGCDVVIVDDMIDTAGTLCAAAGELKKKGARRIFAFATHGLFSGPAMKRIHDSVFEEVVVTDSIHHPPKLLSSNPKITTLSIAVLLADAVRRVNNKESLKDLFHK